MGKQKKTWDDLHCEAWQAHNLKTDTLASDKNVRDSLESAHVLLIKAWEHYAHCHRLAHGAPIMDDGYTGPIWESIGDEIRQLLNCDFGPRLDGGSLDARILAHMQANGVNTENK